MSQGQPYSGGGYRGEYPAPPAQSARPPGGARPRRKRRMWPAVVIAVLLFAAGVLVALALFTLFSGGSRPVENAAQAPNQLAGAVVQGGPPYIVALDAGHGGNDVGAEGVIRETELTEKTVEYLYQLLADNGNFTPVLCRELGQGASIDDRVAQAADAGAALLLSVHGNSDPTYNSSGFECFPKPPGRAYHDESLLFAGYLAEEMIAAGSGFRGENGVRYLYFIQQADGSYERAYREVSDHSTYSDLSLGIVERATCPAVLAEQCYVTNQSDVQAFGTDAGCQKAAECYYRAICRYFGV